MEETISLKEIFDVVKKRFGLIISITVGAALVAAVVSFFVLTPIYQSSTQFIVNQSQQENDNNMQIDSNMIRTNVQLINTYNVVIKSKAILGDVIEDLNLDASLGALEDQIQVSSEEESQVVTVTVKDPDPVLATSIANTTVEVFQDKIVDIMNVDNVKILSEAETKVNPTPVEPRPTLNIAIAVVLGAMVGVGIAFLLEYLDTSIRTEQDVEQKLDVHVIGAVSTMNTEDIQAHRTDPINMTRGGRQHVQAQKKAAK